jgi:hypothetical protein
MTFPAPPGRDLCTRELAAVASEMARRPELWNRHVAFPAEGRHYVSLYRDDHLDVWLLCWTAGSDTGWHDHDGSAGAVRVVAGTLTESTPRISGVPAELPMPAGRSFTYAPDHIHRLTSAAAQSTSIHAYSPPLRWMGQYTIDDAGVLHRVPIGYADELRPIAVAAGPAGAS